LVPRLGYRSDSAGDRSPSVLNSGCFPLHLDPSRLRV
jgi:hypothetical protein